MHKQVYVQEIRMREDHYEVGDKRERERETCPAQLGRSDLLRDNPTFCIEFQVHGFPQQASPSSLSTIQTRRQDEQVAALLNLQGERGFCPFYCLLASVRLYIVLELVTRRYWNGLPRPPYAYSLLLPSLLLLPSIYLFPSR